MLFDKDTSKCFDKDITEYQDKHHNKRIYKYKTKLINTHPSSPYTVLIHTAPTPPQCCPHAAASRTRAAPLQPSRRRRAFLMPLHAAARRC